MTPESRIKLSDFVADFVSGLGIKHLFTLPGGGCMHLTDSFGRHPGMENICNLHEQACAVAADAYSQYTGNLGVCLVTTGPGGTNTLTGVAGSWLDSIPVLIISGQVRRAQMAGDREIRQMGFQEINIVKLAEPVTKYAVTVADPDMIAFHLEKAVYLAKTGRPGPVWIDIPLDVQAKMISTENMVHFTPDSEIRGQRDDDLKKTCGRLAEMLETAERPAILAGNGIRLSGGLDIFESLIHLLKIPVLTTWKAIDFLEEDHPYFCGRPGAIGQRGANFVQQNADLLIVLGARLDPGQTGYSHVNFAPKAKICMVDIDPAEINKMERPVELPVHADCRRFLSAFNRNMEIHPPERNMDKWSKWLIICKNWQKKYPVILPEYYQETGHINTYVLIDVLSKNLDEGDLIIPGSSGACSEVTMQAFKVKKDQRIFNTEGLGPMGFGVPASLGGCIASGGKRTVCIDGDGGFVMNIQDLETVVRLNLPVKYFILNNRGYGSIRNTQNNYFNGRLVASDPDSGLTLPDYCKIAGGFGIRNYRLKTHGELEARIFEILDSNGPVICDIVTPFTQVTAPRLSSVQKADGTFESRPLENLWPFLSREELEENMRVSSLQKGRNP